MKHYLRQAHKVELRINNKLEQLESLRALAEKTTTTLSQTPKGQSGGKETENIIVKIIDLENEIKSDIEGLLDIKYDVQSVIKSVEEPELELLLELRYLCYRSWEDIAGEMNYDLSWIHRLHNRALSKLKANKPLKTTVNHTLDMI